MLQRVKSTDTDNDTALSMCRFCAAPLQHVFVDLGTAPLSNAFLTEADLVGPETFYPLRAWVCERCFLVQLPVYQSPRSIFDDYPYFSSYSDTWIQHVTRFAAEAVQRFGLSAKSRVVEVASNDGCLLKAFKERGVAILGVEPARNIAQHAVALGIPTINEFFDETLAAQLAATHGKADLLVANNVLAQVPDLNGFVAGLRVALAPGGVLSIEVPHLLRLMRDTQYDTIYHEHFSYFSFTTLSRILERQGLSVFDVEALPTHGGSLRALARHSGYVSTPLPSVQRLLRQESDSGLLSLDACRQFANRVEASKRALIRFLIDARAKQLLVIGYGAPAKGNTLLNYCGIRSDLVPYTVDRSPHKQGKYLPGSRIPVYAPDRIAETRPPFVLVLPWNIKAEIISQMSVIREWDGKFVIPGVELEVL